MFPPLIIIIQYIFFYFESGRNLYSIPKSRNSCLKMNLTASVDLWHYLINQFENIIHPLPISITNFNAMLLHITFQNIFNMILPVIDRFCFLFCTHKNPQTCCLLLNNHLLCAIGTDSMCESLIKFRRSQHFDLMLFVSSNFLLQNGHSVRPSFINSE